MDFGVTAFHGLPLPARVTVLEASPRLGGVLRSEDFAGRTVDLGPDGVLGRRPEAVELCRSIGVTEQTYYRWRAEYGGLKLDQAKRLKELERENARLKRAVADLTLDKLILKEAAEGNF